jgi:hypothetical protein
MSKGDILSYLIMGLCCLGFLVLAVVAVVSSIRQVGRFGNSIRAKKSGWDALIARTGLQWESKSPDHLPGAAKAPAYNPVAERLFGGDVADKSGRVVGTYRGYPVVLCNQTFQQEHSMMVTGQTYYTAFHLTTQNPANVRLRVSKDDRQLRLEPQEMGTHLLRAVPAFERLTQSPTPFGIELQQQNLTYFQPGMENDEDRLFTVLEAMCDLADAVGPYTPR